MRLGILALAVAATFSSSVMAADRVDEFEIEILPAELIPENFNSAESLWNMICRLRGEA